MRSCQGLTGVSNVRGSESVSLCLLCGVVSLTMLACCGYGGGGGGRDNNNGLLMWCWLLCLFVFF